MPTLTQTINLPDGYSEEAVLAWLRLGQALEDGVQSALYGPAEEANEPDIAEAASPETSEKPRRRRRTKADIEAESKAAAEAQTAPLPQPVHPAVPIPVVGAPLPAAPAPFAGPAINIPPVAAAPMPLPNHAVVVETAPPPLPPVAAVPAPQPPPATFTMPGPAGADGKTYTLEQLREAVRSLPNGAIRFMKVASPYQWLDTEAVPDEHRHFVIHEMYTKF